MRKMLLIVLFSVLALGSNANVPCMLNFPGKLTNNTGNPVSGIKTIAFTFYDAESAGVQKWTGSYSVNIEKGIFNVVLGSGAYPFPVTLDFNQDYWMEMKVDSEVLSPRQKLMSVAYSMRSEFTNRADTPMVISGCGDIDDNVSEKLYFHLTKMPRNITLYLYGEKFNTQYYTELAAHDHGVLTSDQSSTHTHSVLHSHKVVLQVTTGNTSIYGCGYSSNNAWASDIVEQVSPTTSSSSNGHNHSINNDGIFAATKSSIQKMFLNDAKIYLNGENVSNEVTGIFLSKTTLSKFGDGTQTHQLNTTTGSGPIDITSQIVTTGQHFLVFKQSGINQGGRIRYYLYITY